MNTEFKNEIARVLAAKLVKKGTEVAEDLLSGREFEPQSLNVKQTVVGAAITAGSVIAESKLPKFLGFITKGARSAGLYMTVGATTDYVVDNVIAKITQTKVKALK